LKPDSRSPSPAIAIEPRWVTDRQRQMACPQVYQQSLYLDQADSQLPHCLLDSPAWFAWLETAIVFRYQTTATIPLTRGYTRPAGPISLRKEQRRQGFFWYAYRRQGGQLLKRYVGRSAALTGARLDEVAIDLNLG